MIKMQRSKKVKFDFCDKINIRGGKVNKSVTDIIEEFIISSLDDDDFIELSRNDLAKFFSCVPSQINYVLNTRFTVNRGFLVESQRGGSGYIKVTRVQDNDENFLNNVLYLCRQPLTILQTNQIVANMIDKKIITSNEAELIKSATSAKALNNPINMDNQIRSNIMSAIVIHLMKGCK